MSEIIICILAAALPAAALAAYRCGRRRADRGPENSGRPAKPAGNPKRSEQERLELLKRIDEYDGGVNG